MNDTYIVEWDDDEGREVFDNLDDAIEYATTNLKDKYVVIEMGSGWDGCAHRYWDVEWTQNEHLENEK